MRVRCKTSRAVSDSPPNGPSRSHGREMADAGRPSPVSCAAVSIISQSGTYGALDEARDSAPVGLGRPLFVRRRRAGVFCVSASRRLRMPRRRPKYTASGVTLPETRRVCHLPGHARGPFRRGLRLGPQATRREGQRCHSEGRVRAEESRRGRRAVRMASPGRRSTPKRNGVRPSGGSILRGARAEPSDRHSARRFSRTTALSARVAVWKKKV